VSPVAYRAEISTIRIAKFMTISASRGQECQFELTQMRRIGNGIDLGDLALFDRHLERQEQPPTRRHCNIWILRLASCCPRSSRYMSRPRYTLTGRSGTVRIRDKLEGSSDDL
jgi:hypothetical protein